MSSATAKKYRELRESQGWSHEELASKIDRQTSEVQGWENGDSEPDDEAVGRLADAYGMSQDALRHHGNFEHHEERETEKRQRRAE